MFPLPVQNPPTGFRPIGPSSGRYLKKYKLPTVQAKSSEVTGKENVCVHCIHYFYTPSQSRSLNAWSVIPWSQSEINTEKAVVLKKSV